MEDGRLKPSALEPLLSQTIDVQEELADAAIKTKTVRGITSLVKAHNRRAEMVGEVSRTQESKMVVPEDADPLEALVLSELQDALQHLLNAKGIRVSTPEMVDACTHVIDEISGAWGTINDDLFKENVPFHLFDHEEALFQERSKL